VVRESNEELDRDRKERPVLSTILMGYFNTNIAFTCAETVPILGPKTPRVGARLCTAIAMGLALRWMGAITANVHPR